MKKFSDLNIVRQYIKDNMPLDRFIALADARYSKETGNQCDPIEMVNEHLYKKHCDLDSHMVDADGTKDSTASFTIAPQKELYYCFGCGASGDRFNYISSRFHVDHIQAIKMAAEIQGLDLSQFYQDLSPEEQIKINLFTENGMARDIANQKLMATQRALDYLHGRGFSDESIETYKIGYAEPLNNGNVTMFESIGNSVALQLHRKDQFNDAILFPICDTNGNMRYFQSRPFNPITGMKYIGANDTHPLFDETDRIFGFDVAKRKIYKNGGKLIGVEGAPDTIVCNQHGLTVVGFLGTVVNQKTFDLLDKYKVSELILLLDGDDAGWRRSFQISEKYLTLKTGVRLKVAIMPEGDPDEYINKYGVEELKKIIDNAPYSIEYLIGRKWDELNPVTPTGKLDFMNAIKPYIYSISDMVTRKIMMEYIATKVGFDPTQLDDYYAQSSADTSGAKLVSPDGEETLLGEALRNPDFIVDLTMRFKDDDWYLARTKNLFRIIKNAQHVDIDSVFTTAKNLNIDHIVTHDWLEHLYDKGGNVEFALTDVEDKLMRRKALQIIDKTKQSITNMNNDVVLELDKSNNSIYNVMHSHVTESIFDGKQQADSAMKLIVERMQHPGEIIGYRLGDGFKKTERVLLGIQTKTLTVVAANQSVGKTQICENWAMHQCINDRIGVLWFTLEMDSDRMTFRHLSILSGVNATDIMTGNVTMEQLDKIQNASLLIHNAPFYMSEKGHDLSEALSIAHRYVKRNNVKIIYIDYAQLQYVSDRKTNQRYQELGWISKAWKQFAKDTDTAVILISQLSKEALKAITAEAEHGAGSYEIAQDADNYVTLKEKSEEEINQRGIDHGNLTENISKNRMGTKEVLIDLFADRVVHRIYEV